MTDALQDEPPWPVQVDDWPQEEPGVESPMDHEGQLVERLGLGICRRGAAPGPLVGLLKIEDCFDISDLVGRPDSGRGPSLSH